MTDPNKDEDDKEKTGVNSLHRSRSANRKPNHKQSEGYTDKKHERPSRIIRNSSSGSFTKQISATPGDKESHEKFGARPKEFPCITAQNQATKERNSGDNIANRSRQRPKKPPRYPSERRYSRQNSECADGVKTPENDIRMGKSCEKNSEKLTENTKIGKKQPENAKKGQNTRVKGKENRPSGAKGKDNFLPKKSHAKVTHLYVVLNEDVSPSTDVKAYLMHRMGNPKALTFDLESALNVGKNKNSMITIVFESYNKASVARHMLIQSNKNSTSKIKCFFEQPLTDDQLVDKSEEKRNKLELAFCQIFYTAANVFEKHEAKIHELVRRLSLVETEIRKRALSLHQFEQYSSEKLAFEDKLDELEKQRKEFRKYMDGMQLKLGMLIGCDKFEKELGELRKEFGIECRRIEAGLPMYARREDILTLVKENQVCVIIGETGSGKSTQMAQYIYQAGFAAEGLIAITQPRKIAAINLATRVASEMATAVGQEVGYKVGMQHKSTTVTKLMFMTDHILLNECLNDENLTKYSCVLIDEAHERSIYTDLLLGMLKKALTQRSDLKVIITSATIDPDIFVNYFGGISTCPVMKVSGKTFPVDVFWEEDNYFKSSFPDDYESKAMSKAIEIHQTEDINAGDILVFLTSAVEIERCSEKVKNKLGDSVHCLQLHGKLKADEQQLVFKETPKGKRKIVFATNSAETSVTIPGIKFVVDSGVVKEMRFDPKKNMNTLDVVSVSQSSANQRKGRAGRTAKGVCYRLYSQSDFNRMNKMSSPEILRIQVSQALLKLMELGIDPLKFDYVQPPSSEAMKSAMSELCNLGAVRYSSITDLGKWIAKLPVEPKLGVFIKKGIDMEITSEALVVASCCNQTGIFFRVGTKEQKEASDMKKMKFCHVGGDLITMLNVYREWDKVNEKAKGRWCQNNSINGKAMKMIRDMANEIITSIKKDLGIQIKHSFKAPEEADELVQKLVFECMSSNLGYFLGHETAGYLVVNRFQRVKIHPSSAVLSLGMEPRWVIFNRVLKTSDDYMTEITPVSEDMITDAVQSGKICLDLEALKRQTMKCALRVPIGKHVFWKYVSSFQTIRKQVEKNISAVCDDSVVIAEANKIRGEIALFCLPTYKSTASAILLSCVDSIRQQLLNESMEEFIGCDGSGVRAQLHLGGSVINILMPDEFRSLNIKEKENSQYDLDEETLKDIFEFYSPVEQIRRYFGKKQYNSPFWGTVTFTHDVDAVAAMDDVNEDTENDFTLVPITFRNHKPNSNDGFTMKVTWCRRPTKGHCFVECERPEDTVKLLGSTLRINGDLVSVQLAKRGSNLFIKGLSHDALEVDVKAAIERELDITLVNQQQRFKVIIPRQNTVFVQDEWQRKRVALSNLVSMYASSNSFGVNVLKYSEKTVMVRAFVKFSDAEVYYETAQQMVDDDLDIDGHELHIYLDCKTNVHVTGRLYNMVADDIDALFERYRLKNSSTTLELQRLKSGNWLLQINAESPRKLAKAKVRADKVVGGDILDCGMKENLHALFCSVGKRLAEDVGKRTGTLIFIDERKMKVTVQGREQNRVHAIQKIDEFIANRKSSVEIEVRLKGEENPPGLLKALLVKYGIQFGELKNETGISGIKLNLRRHEITLTGTEETVKQASDKIKELREGISKTDTASTTEMNINDCPICLCPVEENDMYRLEYCGHAYCRICVASQLQSAVADRKMPVVCEVEDCKKPFVIRDITAQLKLGNIKKKEFVDATVTCLVTERSDAFRYCITPNCEVVYRTTTEGSRFYCPVCHARICTACHIEFHDGLTCAMYKSAKEDDGSLEKWMKEKPKKRKMCPNCHLGIEKIEGCDHMTCKCGVHICWKCLAHFPDSQECYGHLQTVHGSFI